MDPFPGVDPDVWGTEVGWGYQHTHLEKERSLQPAAWKLETLVSANLLRAPWFLPKEMRDDASHRMNRPLEGLVWIYFTFRREV